MLIKSLNLDVENIAQGTGTGAQHDPIYVSIFLSIYNFTYVIITS